MLALSSVSKWYGEVCALNRLSMSIPDNCHTSVLGGSGSGKTTLLRVIAGFEDQDEETVTLNESRLDGAHPHRRGMGFVFQNFASFLDGAGRGDAASVERPPERITNVPAPDQQQPSQRRL